MLQISNVYFEKHSINLLKCLVLFTAFVFFNIKVEAKNYYFSSSTGDDLYSSTQAQNAATPWKSIAKLNSFFNSIVAGDIIYFKRGDTFYGSIIVTRSGNSTNRITFDAYGTGNKPIISGFTTLSSWTSVGNGIYQATASGISNAVNMVTVNNQPQQMGRYPNADAANGGYLTYESFSTKTSITDNQLTASPNWTGAELVIRKKTYITENCKIVSHSGSTISYTSIGADNGTNGYGYFIQKDAKTLDQLGEWYYNPSTKFLQMYFGASLPSTFSIRISTVDILLNISGFSYITVKNLAFEGANVSTINIGSLSSSSSNNILSYCDINFSGRDAVYGTNTKFSTIEYCNILNSYNNAIHFENEGGLSDNTTIRNNSIKNSGFKAGMGNSGESYQGICVFGNNSLIEYNSLDSIGYLGIAFYYNNAKVRNNFINNFAFVKDDGSGIYTHSGIGGPVYSGREVKNNIILNGIGAGTGTSQGLNTVHGIYADDGAEGIDITGNSVANMPFDGIYVHNSHEINVSNNTLYNCGLQQVLFVHDTYAPNDPIRNVVFKNNIMVAKTPAQLCFNIRSIKDDINLTGATDSNYYARPVLDDIVFSGLTPVVKATYALGSWKSNFTKDGHSKKSPKILLPYKINSLTTANLLTNGDFASNLSGITFWSQNSNQSAIWDGTSKITGTGSLKISFPVSTPNVYSMTVKSVGAVSVNKNYILRFNTLGTTSNGMLRAYIRTDASPYNNIVPVQEKSFGTSVVNHEFLFSAPTTVAAASIVIEFQQNSGTTYIDNIAFFEANITPVNVYDQMRFEYNATNITKTITLDAKYIGIDSTIYNGSVTLQPYSSKVLLLDGPITGTLPPPPPPPSQIITATATVPVISCFGGNTTVAVAGAGGTAPYTGTGSFTVNAGTGSLKISVANPVVGNYTSLYSTIGAVSNTKNYVLRFSTLGTTASGSLRAGIRQTNTPWANITSAQSKTFGTTRVDHEFIFTAPPTTAAASFFIEVLQSSGVTYIDNIAFFEATSAGVLVGNNLYGSGQFEGSISGIYTWSPTNNHVAALDLTSKISNTYYYRVNDATGAIGIATAITSQPGAALQATSTAGVVTTTGGKTTVVVAATGGTAPYTGTGSFANVGVGTYNYTVTDARGCTAVTTVTVTQNIAATITATATAPVISCFGGNTTVAVAGAGGTAPYTGTGSFTVNAGTGSLKISVANPVAGNYTSLYSTIGAVTNTKNYVLRFSTLGTTASGSLRAGIRQTNTPWANITSAQSSTFGIARINHEFIFTAPPTTAAASFFIEILQSSGVTYIDNIAFFEATSAGIPVSNNLYASGQFESSISGIYTWSPTNNHVAALDLTSKISNTYYYRVNDANGAIGIATAVTFQPAAALLATSTAGVITTTGGKTTVVVAATGGTAPYTGTGSFANVGVGTYNYTVTDARGCTSVTTITVTQNVAARIATTNTNSITSEPLRSNAIDEITALKINSYPNPTAAEFNLMVQGGSNEMVNISVTSIDGRIVYKTQGYTNKKYTFGNSFMPGMYIIQVLQGKTMQTLKVIKVK